MVNLISFEMYKIFRKWRSYIGFFAITLLVVVVETAMYFEGDKYLSYLTRSLQDTFVFSGNLLNGYLIAYYVLGALVIHTPFLITLVTGDLLAGEATGGTYRVLLSRPFSRTRLITAKFIAGQIYICLLLFWLALLSIGLGTFMFGVGELIVVSQAITVFAKNDILWRFLFAYLFAWLSMGVVGALAFLFSSFVENAIGPIISTMAIIIIFLILSAINIEFFENLQPYLFTSYMMEWRSFFDFELQTGEIIKSCLILLGHIGVLYSATLIFFRKRDILS